MFYGTMMPFLDPVTQIAVLLTSLHILRLFPYFLHGGHDKPLDPIDQDLGKMH